MRGTRSLTAGTPSDAGAVPLRAGGSFSGLDATARMAGEERSPGNLMFRSMRALSGFRPELRTVPPGKPESGARNSFLKVDLNPVRLPLVAEHFQAPVSIAGEVFYPASMGR